MKYDSSYTYINSLKKEKMLNYEDKLVNKYVNVEGNIFLEKIPSGVKLIPISSLINSWDYNYSNFIKEVKSIVNDNQVIVIRGNNARYGNDHKQKLLIYFMLLDKINASWISDGILEFKNGKMIVHT